MNKVPNPRNLLPKKLRRAMVFCAIAASACSAISLAMNSMTLLRLNAFLGQAQKSLPKLEEAAQLYIKQHSEPTREKKMIFPKAEKQG